MNHQTRQSIRRIIIDESVSAAQWLRFQAHAKAHAVSIGETYSVKERHPGIPDRLILQQLLDQTTVLLTADRPLHNQALEMGLQSFHVGESQVTGRALPGIQSGTLRRSAQHTAELKADYRPVSPALRSVLMPSSPQRLKKLTVKRRRIRNHFGGLDQLAQSAISVSYVAHGATTLLGVRLRISSHSDVKTLDASESYIAESVEPGSRDLAAFCHALIVPIQLLLHQVSTVVYYDAIRMMGPHDQPSGHLTKLFSELTACFPHLTFTPVIKGWHLERIQHKLNDLRTASASNEVLPGILCELLQQQSVRIKSPEWLQVP